MSRLQQDFLFDGRYRLRKKLGEGGFSEVWLVDDTSAKITLVLKVFLPSSQLDESGIEMFRQEFALVYNLNHPNLLKYTYYGVCVGHPYLVMPYYNSGSAEDLLGNCSERKAWQFLHDVSAGLACMHEHQPPIIHQDIKPANVLLDGSSYIITDFGISGKARSILGDGSDGQSTVQGTRPYMPPEKFRRDQIPLVASDIWALGASLYEMLTGRLPFGGKGGEAQLQGAEIPSLPDSFSDDLRQIITQCLLPEPTARPHATDLEQFAAVHLAQGPFTSGAIHTSTSYGGSYGSSIHIETNTPEPEPVPTPNPTPTPEPKTNKALIIGIAAAVLVSIVVILSVVLFGGKGSETTKQSGKISQQQEYEEVMTFYRRGVQFYNQGMNNTQGQLTKFQQSLDMFDSAKSRKNPEFSESTYPDSINTMRGRMYDYCLETAKRDYSAAFLENGIRQTVLEYLKFAKNINDNSEVNSLIDSIQYIYISEQ